MDLNHLTHLRVRATQRAEQYQRIIEEASRLLHEAQEILLNFPDPYHPPASHLLWQIEASFEVLVDALLGLWAEEMEDREREQQIWAHLE
ncbi:hypothetical protein N7465_001189 [Penicillium sp. CMV-2018d]|nr:hypothetical protein N7465_001189 [Penicillium sp. CMV-2018d]